MLGNVPHDWLFKHVSCVVHHGGAGTTAAGIALGKPTVVVPFFGDQPFWGAMIARAEAGPNPIPKKQLTAENLASGMMMCLQPKTVERAKDLGARISSEKGTTAGAESFHRHLDSDALKCNASPKRAATWRVRKTGIKLSAFAATTLCNEGLLKPKNLKLYRSKGEYLEHDTMDPLSATLWSSFGAAGDSIKAVADLPVDIYRASKAKSAEAPIDTVQPSAPRQSNSLPVESSDSQLATQDPTSSNALTKSGSDPGPSAGQASLNMAVATGKGLGKLAGLGVTVPMDVTLNLAKGFHNVPRMYGDKTVRKQERVTGLGSGLKAAGKVRA